MNGIVANVGKWWSWGSRVQRWRPFRVRKGVPGFRRGVVDGRAAWMDCAHCGDVLAAVPSDRNKLPLLLCCNAHCDAFRRPLDIAFPKPRMAPYALAWDGAEAEP